MMFALLLAISALAWQIRGFKKVFKSQKSMQKEWDELMTRMKESAGEHFEALYSLSVLTFVGFSMVYNISMGIYMENKIVTVIAALFVVWRVHQAKQAFENMNKTEVDFRSIPSRLFGQLVSISFTLYIISLILIG